MPTKSKETLTAEKSSTASTAKKAKEKATKATATTTKKSTRQSNAKKSTATKQKTESAPQATAVQEELIVTAVTDTVAAPPSEVLPTVPAEVSPKETNEQMTNENISEHIVEATRPADAGIEVGNGLSFRASELMNGKIWAPNVAIPGLDEATYAAQKAQAEAQRRAIEVASLNLQNMNDLQKLERESIGVAISAKANETRTAQLDSANLDYETQLEMNGEKMQHLAQAASKHQSAVRETGYVDQLIELKDQNLELDVQQAQNVFAEKAARYRAQLTGG